MHIYQTQNTVSARPAADMVSAILGSATLVLIAGNHTVIAASLTCRLSLMLDSETSIVRRAAILAALTRVGTLCLR